MTTSKFSSYNQSQIVLALGLILPFFLFKQAPPNISFLSELTSIIIFSIFCLYTHLTSNFHYRISNISLFLILLSSYILISHLFIPSSYTVNIYLTVLVIFFSSILSSNFNNYLNVNNSKKVFVGFCVGLVIGALLQDIVLVCQLLGLPFNWVAETAGNIGQRNLLAHYLSWGIVATTHLIYINYYSKTNIGLLVFQAILLGTVNSRTLLIYDAFIILLLVFVTFQHKYLDKKAVQSLFLSTSVVLVFQAITLPILSIVLGNLTIENTNSIARMGNSSGMLSRIAEWHKALLIFKNHFWLGAGWDSYSLQSFIISNQPIFKNTPYEARVFSHSHNLVFNLLAEVGVVGTIMFIGGFIYLLKPIVKKNWTVETIFLLSMLIITITHSLIEYPLWYTHFFLVFILILTLLLNSLNTHSKAKPIINRKPLSFLSSFNISICFIVIFYLIFSIQIYYAYNKLYEYQFSLDNSESQKLIDAKKMLAVGHDYPLLSVYAETNAVNNLIGIPIENIPKEFIDPLKRQAYYRPTREIGIYYLLNQCYVTTNWNKDEWQYYSNLNNYFKDTLPAYSMLLSQAPNCKTVYKQVHNECQNYYIKKGQYPVCSYEDRKYFKFK